MTTTTPTRERRIAYSAEAIPNTQSEPPTLQPLVAKAATRRFGLEWIAAIGIGLVGASLAAYVAFGGREPEPVTLPSIGAPAPGVDEVGARGEATPSAELVEAAPVEAAPVRVEVPTTALAADTVEGNVAAANTAEANAALADEAEENRAPRRVTRISEKNHRVGGMMVPRWVTTSDLRRIRSGAGETVVRQQYELRQNR